ncbi:autotransporter outer membrane beta-barrel domain-containing protein [Bartonella taylorii]|uniref:autotransporter family protein n=1 Tax=Bartonella taylorii TaxID=33046 RepID=UPI001ABAC1AF|nr:autotransporter outer membrane beta-barrel domain-containing protein [Bartonella taylorii]
MIKVFRNHVCLCTFTTAIFSLLQNGIVVGANIGEEGRKPYNISVFPLPPSVPLSSSPREIPSRSGTYDYNGNNGFSEYGYSGGYNSLKGESGSVGVNSTDISITSINSIDPATPISVYRGPDGNGYIGINGYEVLDSNSISGSSHNRFFSGSNHNGLSGERVSSESGSVDSRVLLGGDNSSRTLSGDSGDNGHIEYNRFDVEYNGGKQSLYDGLYYMCDGCGNRLIDNQSYKITNENVSNYPSDPTAITVKGIGTRVIGKNVTVSSQVADKTFLVGVHVLENGKIVLEDPILKGTVIALRASDGVIEVKNGKIEKSHEGVDATENSFVLLEDTEIKTANGIASLLSYEHSEVWMSGGSVDFMNSHGISSMLGGKINLENVEITGKANKGKDRAVVHMDSGGAVNLEGSIVSAGGGLHGILLEATVDSIPLQEVKDLSNEDYDSKIPVTEVNMKSSSVTVKGKGSYGIYLRGEKPWSEGEAKKEEISSEKEKNPPRLEVVNFDKTEFSVLDDAALYGRNIISGAVGLVHSTLRSGNFLLKAEEGASITVLADASTLEGRTYVDKNSNAKLYLGGHSKWILQQPLQKDQDEAAHDSSISHITLMNDSSIKFTKSKPDQSYIYQTLSIGKGTGEVYRAQDGAQIYLNTYLNSGGTLDHQQTDRVLIYGDVSGITTVHVHGVSGSPGESTGSGGNNQGISIIQVSGEAKEHSFQLYGGYVALKDSPYQYRLYAYGPTSGLGEADSTQRLVKGSGEFWDFRLENGYIDSDPKPEPAPIPRPEPEPSPDLRPEPAPAPGPDPKPHPKPGIKAVVPQVPTYLLLPNALFHAGLMNISNQNNRLEALRTTSNGMLEIRENPAFFVRGYGGNYRYVSNLSALEYGYGGELDSNAIEAGVLLQTVENAYGATSFGVIGSYERLSLQPLDVEKSQKSTFNKWSVTAYGGMQWDTGFYADGLLSYGLFKGDVLTLARGKTATLKGTPLSASLTSGKAFMIGDKGLIFDPQVQVVYQRLQFNKTRDIDNFDIDMGKLDQWVARVGGRLTKTLAATDEAGVVSFYGKLHLTHGFGGKQSVHFKDAFQLGAFGSSLETGLGFNAQLSQKFALHGDLMYQHKLTKAGFSGTSFSGGLRYHF